MYSETSENTAFQTPSSNIKVANTREGAAKLHTSVFPSASAWNLRGISQISQRHQNFGGKMGDFWIDIPKSV